MEFFKWKDSFNIGVEGIDRQHRSFLECLNDCYQDLCRGKETAIDRDLVSRLRTYASTHFRHEEDLMHSRNYPLVIQHEAQHRYFESQVSELEQALAGRKERTPESILPFLRDWFLKHILEQDKKIVQYLK